MAVTVPPHAGAAPSCNPKNSVGYVSRERCEVCGDGIECVNAIPTVQTSQRRAGRGDLDGAIAAMEEAVKDINRYTRRRIQRWDNLAELYCLRAAQEHNQAHAMAWREEGMRMIGEYRCGVSVLQGRQACALASTRAGDGDSATLWGRVPNPAMTPLCFASFCDVGFQRDDDFDERNDAGDDETNRWDAYLDEPEDIARDAANLGEIEKLCRRGQE
jgi:hypothetical protein